MMPVMFFGVALVCLVPAVFAVVHPRNPVGSRPIIIDHVSAALNPSPPKTLLNKQIPPPRLVAPVLGRPRIFRYPGRSNAVLRTQTVGRTNSVLSRPHPPASVQSSAAMTNRLINPPQPLPRPVSLNKPPIGPMGLTVHDVAAINNVLASFLTTQSPYYQSPTYGTFGAFNHNFGRSSDCECQQGQDRCQAHEIYNRDCEDGVVCCAQLR